MSTKKSQIHLGTHEYRKVEPAKRSHLSDAFGKIQDCLKRKLRYFTAGLSKQAATSKEA